MSAIGISASGGFRVLFEETETEIIVKKIGPRGSVYAGKV
jgi:hypothetical protein